MRYSLIITMIVTLGLVSGNIQASTPTASTGTRYVYCNVYMTDACFGLASGDVMKMELPADFVLRTVSLWNGVQAVIYEGNQPEDAFTGKTAKPCPTAVEVRKCQYAVADSQMDVLYQAMTNAQVIQLHITGITAANRAGVADFLLGFHRCKAVGQSEQCSDERPFSGIH